MPASSQRMVYHVKYFSFMCLSIFTRYNSWAFSAQLLTHPCSHSLKIFVKTYCSICHKNNRMSDNTYTTKSINLLLDSAIFVVYVSAPQAIRHGIEYFAERFSRVRLAALRFPVGTTGLFS